jgi:hypothetical protein
MATKSNGRRGKCVGQGAVENEIKLWKAPVGEGGGMRGSGYGTSGYARRGMECGMGGEKG